MEHAEQAELEVDDEAMMEDEIFRQFTDLEQYNLVVEKPEEYLQLIMQFGYLAMFGPAFPLGAAVALGVNFVEIRYDAHKLLYAYRRVAPLQVSAYLIAYCVVAALRAHQRRTSKKQIPYPPTLPPIYPKPIQIPPTNKQKVNNIGEDAQFVLILYLAVPVNLGLVLYTFEMLGGDDAELPAGRVWIFMLATLLFIVLQVAVERLVPDKTFKTLVQEQRQECKFFGGRSHE